MAPVRTHLQWAVGVALLAAAASVKAQHPRASGPPQRTPPFAFSATTRLVQINVAVDGPDGPVRGLQASDFSLTDNGQRREIQFFSADSPIAPASASAAIPSPAKRSAASSGPAAFTNVEPRSANMLVVLVDALNSADGTTYVAGVPGWTSSHSFAFARQGALRFLRQLPDGVSVALYALDARLHVLADFTSDRSRLLRALQQYTPEPVQHADSGAPATGVPGGFDALNAEASRQYNQQVAAPRQIEGTAPALRAIADHLTGVPGRVSLVWIMTRPPLPGAMVEQALGRDNIAVYPVDARGLMAWDLQFTADHPLGFGAVMRTQPPGLPRFDDIARQTGGRAFTNTNDFAGALASAARESSASYTLGFYVPAAALDGRFHPIRVRVKGKHLDARFAHGYWATPDGATQPRNVAQIAAALAYALASPLDDSGMPLTAQLAPASKGLMLRAALGIGRMSIPMAGGRRSGEVVIETVVQNAAGATVGFSRHTLSWRWSEVQYEQHLHAGVQFAQRIVPAADGVRLRLLVEDAASGAVGSLTLPLAPRH